jgi:hypothetical protein
MNKEYFLAKKWHIALGIVVLITVLSGVFSLGVRVGFHKAGFNGRLGERYERNFEGGRRGPDMMGRFSGGRGMMFDRELPSAYTTAGEILDMNRDGFTVIDNDGVEKNVAVNDKTLIRKFRDDIRLSDLQAGDPVIVMGAPNSQGQIEARLIRVMPTPPAVIEKVPSAKAGTSTPPAAASSTKK